MIINSKLNDHIVKTVYRNTLVFEKSKMFVLPFVLLIFLRILIPSTIETSWIQTVELIVNVSLLLLSILSSILILKHQIKVWLLGYSFAIFSWIAISNYVSEGSFSQSIIESSIYLIPILIAVNLMEMSFKNPNVLRYLVYIISFSLMIFIIPLIMGDKYVHAGIERLPLFYGTLHDNGYIASIVAIFGFYYFRNFEHRLEGLLIIIFSLFLMHGYAVRSAHVMFLVALVGIYLYRIPIRIRDIFIFKVIFISILALIFFYLFNQDAGKLTTSFSSGRTEMWGDQLHKFFNADFISMIIGFGVKGDMIVTKVWAWESKGAHSTLLSFLLRYGIGGLILILFFLYRLFIYLTLDKKCKKCLWLYIAFLSTLIISNGLMERFVPFILFLLLFIFLVKPKEHSI